MNVLDLRTLIERAWEARERLQEPETIAAIDAVIAAIDTGELRVAEPTA